MQKHGFTLIELSIVLVIIGLLAGGVLVGKDLIEVARLRTLYTQTVEYDTAINAFRGKYGCLAGDCHQASVFFPGAYNGNGNGVVEQVMFSLNVEGNFMWQSLARAELIPGQYETPTIGGVPVQYAYGQFRAGYNVPASRYRNDVHIAYIGGAAPLYLIGADRNTANYYLEAAFLTPTDALSLDLKFDNGRPGDGKITAVRGHLESTGCYVDEAIYETDNSISCAIYRYQ